MNRFRTYIARLVIAVLIWTGFSLYMVQPVQGDHSSQSFANWLSKKAKYSEGAELQHRLDKLKESVNQLEDTIKEASQIVSSNSDEFGFSFAGSLASQHIYQLLLLEWNQFQSKNAMASLPIQHISKLVVSATVDKSGVGDFDSSEISKLKRLFSVNIHLVDSQQLATTTVLPMIHGIAIGAP